MFDFIPQIYHFILDKSKHIALRISVPIISLILILIVNDLSGLTRSYFLNKKLDRLIEIQRLEPNVMQTDAVYKQVYEGIKRDILIDHSDLRDWYTHITKNMLNVNILTRTNEIQRNITFNDNFWLDISSMFLSYLLCIVVIVIGIFVSISNKGKQIWGTLLTVIFMLLISLGLGRIFKEAIDLVIPVFTGEVWINVIINGLLQLFIVFIFAFLIKRVRNTDIPKP